MAKITTMITIGIGGQSVSVSSEVIEAQATDKVNVDLEADDSEVTVEIQPSASSQLHVLLLSSSYYGKELTYVLSDGTTDAAVPLTLDGPQMFSAGNLLAIGVLEPTQIKLTMTSSGEAATVSIFVARDAIPTP